MDHDSNCPFCGIGPERIAFASALVIGIWDSFPVSQGHMLIVPRRHASGFEDLNDVEKSAVWSAVDRAMAEIRKLHAPDGFNVGFNQGAAAGQTIFHFHLHVIPRYFGDVSDPRGGVRHVIPAKGNYLAASASVDNSTQRLVTGDDDPFLPHLILQLDRADTCDIAVAFLLDSGARLIAEHLKDFLSRGGRARILVGDYLDVTEPAALRRLADLEGNLSLKVYQSVSKGFHLKSYIFINGAEGVAFVGSSNLSASALTSSIEWNYKVVSSHDQAGFSEICDGFETLLNDNASVAATSDWINKYEQQREVRKPAFEKAGVLPEPPLPTPQPHAVQHEALAALEKTRADGFTAGLVVLATARRGLLLLTALGPNLAVSFLSRIARRS